MKSLLLHIGTGKTGTTSIQHTLDRAARDNILGDISYPRFKGRNHNFLAALYRPYEQLPRIYRSAYASAESRRSLSEDAAIFRERLFEAIRANDRVILSAEYLSLFRLSEAESLKEDLRDAGVDDVCVVVYIRSPASRYLSSVQQGLKASSAFPSPITWRDNFIELLELWGRVAPRMVVRPFAREQLAQGDVVRDFLSVAEAFFGREIPEEGLSKRVRNVSVSAEGMVVLQKYRHLFYPNQQHVFKNDSTRLHKVLEGSRKVVPQTTPRLADRIMRHVAERHEEDLVALWRDYGVDLRVVDDKSVERSNEQELELPLNRIRDVTQILETYDEDTVERLLFHCLREVLLANQTSEGRRAMGSGR